MSYSKQRSVRFREVVILLVLFLVPIIGYAQFSSVGDSLGSVGGEVAGMLARTPYGGRSQEAVYCSCTPGCFKVKTGGPKNAGWKGGCAGGLCLWKHYNIFPIAWQLGLYGEYVKCLQTAYPKCRDDGGGYLMIINGTSRGF